MGESVAECVRRIGGESGERYVKRLDQLSHHKDPRVSVTACEVLLNRGFGKAPQDMNITGNIQTTSTVVHEYHDKPPTP